MPRYLAIDADAPGLVVVAATLPARGGGVAVDRAFGADDAPPLAPATAAALGERLKTLLREAGVKPAPVLLAVGRDRVILKDVRHPPAPPADEPMVVRFQAAKDLADAPDDVAMDYVPAATQDLAGERRALAVFVRKDVLAAARAMCDAAGLRLAAVTPRPFAAAAAARASGAADDPVAVVTASDRGGEFTVVRGAEVAFARAVPPQAAASAPALAAELRRNLAVYAGQNPLAPVRAVLLAEADAAGGRAPGLEAALPVPVRTFDPLAGTPAADLVPPGLRGRFAGAVGLLAARAGAGLPVNFAAPRQPRAEPSKARPKALAAALLGVALVGAVGAAGYLEVDRAAGRVAELAADRDRVKADLDKLQLGADRLKAADEFAGREVVWLDELYDLSARVPDVSKVAVAEFDGQAVPPPRKDARPGQPAPKAAGPGKPAPVAQVRVALRTADDRLAQRVADGFDRRYYAGVNKLTGGGGSAGSGAQGQLYTVTAQVFRRPPGEYVRRLPAAPPAGAGFAGGFGGLDP